MPFCLKFPNLMSYSDFHFKIMLLFTPLPLPWHLSYIIITFLKKMCVWGLVSTPPNRVLSVSLGGHTTATVIKPTGILTKACLIHLNKSSENCVKLFFKKGHNMSPLSKYQTMTAFWLLAESYWFIAKTALVSKWEINGYWDFKWSIFK